MTKYGSYIIYICPAPHTVFDMKHFNKLRFCVKYCINIPSRCLMLLPDNFVERKEVWYELYKRSLYLDQREREKTVRQRMDIIRDRKLQMTDVDIRSLAGWISMCVVSNELVFDSKYKSFTLTNIAIHPWTLATRWTISIKLTSNENENWRPAD